MIRPIMAPGAVLYRFAVELSDVSRGVYTSFDLRAALHPSEDLERLVARCLAYCLMYEEDLRFGPGLSDADEPALATKDGSGRVVHWVDVGYPGAERLHRASKASERVTVVCHKDPEGLRRERDKRRIHQAAKVAVLLLEPALVASVAEALPRNAGWVVVRNDSDLHLSVGDLSFAGSVTETNLEDL